MDKIVVGYVGGDTDLDKAIKYFSDSKEYTIGRLKAHSLSRWMKADHINKQIFLEIYK